jgi:hypothetical protein
VRTPTAYAEAGARRFGSTRTEQFVRAFEGLPDPARDQIQAAFNAGDLVDPPKPLGIDIRRIEDNSSENA